MRLKLSIVAAVLGVVVAIAAVAAVATPSATAAKGGSLAVPAAGTTTTGLPVTGTFTITSFKKVGGVINAVGTYTGSINGGDPVTTTASAPVTSGNGMPLGGASSAGAAAPAAAAAGSCPILNLTLGPLHLDLLGLVVDLNQVNLNITAQQGPGNLLGNLLCAVAGLLDNTGGGTGLNGLLQAITNLLNHILGSLAL
jgi:hypothetical protein